MNTNFHDELKNYYAFSQKISKQNVEINKSLHRVMTDLIKLNTALIKLYEGNK